MPAIPVVFENDSQLPHRDAAVHPRSAPRSSTSIAPRRPSAAALASATALAAGALLAGCSSDDTVAPCDPGHAARDGLDDLL